MITVEKRPRRILLVDDHPVVRDGLEALMATQSDLEVCGFAESAHDALSVLADTGADAVIVDVSLKDSNGIELIREIGSRFPGVAVLVSSMYDESLYAERALRAGAMGYINKQVASRDILTALRQVLDGQIYLSGKLSDRLIRRGLGAHDRKRYTVDDLSTRELEVFELVGHGLRTSDIASRLDLSVKTIETYRQRIKDKLRLKNGADLARCAAQWVLEKPNG